MTFPSGPASTVPASYGGCQPCERRVLDPRCTDRAGECGAPPPGGTARCRSADPDQLLVDELVGAVLAELAAGAGALDAAERQLCAVRADDVHVDHAGIDLVRHPLGLFGIRREEVGAEPERRVVRELDRLLL